MNKPVKFPEIKKEAFTKAREGLGLSTQELSGMACLSARQIEQIENGESSSFYGPQVKYTAAKKVAALLKLKEEDAFDFGGDGLPRHQDAQDATENAATKSAKAEKKQVSAQQDKVEQGVKKVAVSTNAQIDVKAISSELNTKNNTHQNKSQKKLFIFLGIAAAIAFSVVNLRPLFFPEPVKEEIVVVQEVAPASPAPESTQDAKPATTAPEAPAAAAPVVTAAPVISTECPPADTAAVTYKPDAPKKAGDMVYLQSKTAQIVCVVDAAGKTQNKTLEPGVGVSVYGKPPLKVLTSGQSLVDMYFQGAKVRISNTAAKTIILEPAEIIQPANAMDSQLR